MFFELNGQPRTAKVAGPVRVEAGAEQAPQGRCRQILNHVAGPHARRGLHHCRGTPGQDRSEPATCFCTIEAMKMETAIHAERDGKIAQVVVSAGTQVDAKDLLFEFAE